MGWVVEAGLNIQFGFRGSGLGFRRLRRIRYGLSWFEPKERVKTHHFEPDRRYAEPPTRLTEPKPNRTAQIILLSSWRGEHPTVVSTSSPFVSFRFYIKTSLQTLMRELGAFQNPCLLPFLSLLRLLFSLNSLASISLIILHPSSSTPSPSFITIYTPSTPPKTRKSPFHHHDFVYYHGSCFLSWIHHHLASISSRIHQFTSRSRSGL